MTKPDFDLRDNLRLADELERFVQENEWGREAEELLTSAIFALRRTTRHLDFWLTRISGGDQP
jgi:hypothetical protein